MPNGLEPFGRNLGDRQTRVEPAGAAHGIEHLGPPLLDVARLVDEWQNGTTPQRLARVRTDEVRVELGLGAQSGAIRARAKRRVEAEQARLQFGHAEVADRASQVLAVQLVDRFTVLRTLDVQGDKSFAHLERSLDGVGGAPFDAFAHHQAIHHHLDRVRLVAVHRNVVGDLVHHAIHADAHKAGLVDLLQHLLVLALAALHHRSEHLELRPLGQRLDHVEHLVDRLPLDGRAVVGAVWRAHPGEDEPQIVVDLGDRTHGRTRVAAGALLVDAHGRREAFDVVHVGLVHLAEELARIGAEGFDVPPLPLGVDGVERQRRLTAPRKSGDDDQPVAGDLDGDVLEVVLASANDDDFVLSHELDHSSAKT